jgi:hypothetical protein
MDKRSSLFVEHVSDEEGNLNQIFIKSQYYKMFFFFTGIASISACDKF